MSSFEFYVPEAYASCQYDADKFFSILDSVQGKFPLLERVKKSFDALNDDLFSFTNGETMQLKNEVLRVVEYLDGEPSSESNKYSLFYIIAEQLQNVFDASEKNQHDIEFRWG